MTKSTGRPQIDNREAIQQALQEAVHTLSERLFRELRYNPQLNGEVSVTLFIKQGTPKGVRSTAEDNQRLNQ